MDDTVSTRNIRRLEESVINRIAAGEASYRHALFIHWIYICIHHISL